MNNYYDVALKKFGLNELIKYPAFHFINLKISDRKLITDLFEKYKLIVIVNLPAQSGVCYSITNSDTYVESNIVSFN